MAGAISSGIPAVCSLLINKLLFFRAGSAAQLTSYHADISLINKQYRKRGHKLHTAAKKQYQQSQTQWTDMLEDFWIQEKVLI